MNVPEKLRRRCAASVNEGGGSVRRAKLTSDDERDSGGGGLVGKKVKYATVIIDPNSARADHGSRGLWRSRTVVCSL